MKPIYLRDQLAIDSCPHCGRASPTLCRARDIFGTKNNMGVDKKWWGVYACNSCGGVVTAMAYYYEGIPDEECQIVAIYPDIPIISDSIPEKSRELLRQAQNSLHAPAGAIMLCASAVDAMLKEKGYTKGSLYERIDKAAQDHLITGEMSKWAHQIRLDANDQRHADKKSPLPTDKDAKLTFDFALSFAQYLFVLPAMVSRGIGDSETKK